MNPQLVQQIEQIADNILNKLRALEEFAEADAAFQNSDTTNSMVDNDPVLKFWEEARGVRPDGWEMVDYGPTVEFEKGSLTLYLGWEKPNGGPWRFGKISYQFVGYFEEWLVANNELDSTESSR